MHRDYETILEEYLLEHPYFFHEQGIPELPGLEKIGLRGGIYNPYGIPLHGLGGISNPAGIISYMSGIYRSVERRPATDFLIGWVKTGIDQTLYRVMGSNGNALEYYIHEMLIQTRTHERSFFGRPPFELDAAFAMDLFYRNNIPFNATRNTRGINAGKRTLLAHERCKTLGIQITSTPFLGDRFAQKRNQIRGINSHFWETKSLLRPFGYKKPDIMSIVGIYGNIGAKVKQGMGVFCRDLGLPLGQEQIPFEDDVNQEAKDIADFIRKAIRTWNEFYLQRMKHKKLQKEALKGRNGEYTFEWRHNPNTEGGSTIFALRKIDGAIVAHFEIFDAV